MTKKLIILATAVCVFYACSQSPSENSSDNSKKEEPAKKADDGKGIGEFKNVTLNSTLDETMIATGQAIFDMKCSACHRLSEKRLVGPGFKGVTEKRKPEWILNMVTNVDIMLAEDEEAQKLLMECLTRMPNQNVNAEDARSVLEFLLKNDSKS